jgi:hypothetical protein
MDKMNKRGDEHGDGKPSKDHLDYLFIGKDDKRTAQEKTDGRRDPSYNNRKE